MRFSDQTLQQIRERADIVSIASSYLSLEKKGSEYVTVCPFHADHDPSLHISPQKQIYKCFVCNAGGDVFKLVQEMENITFPEAVAKVAHDVGIEIEAPKDNRPQMAPEKKQAIEALDLFNEYCHYTLSTKEGREALAYLKGRKFSQELMDEFSIGFAPDPKRIHAYFRAKNVSIQTLIDAGLVREDNPESLYFYDRITIPIHDAYGRLVAFTCRTLSKDKSVPKYLNTPATPLYEKGRTIFNFYRAAKACKKAGRVILVEGAMDVLGLEKAGIHEGIACLGTAVTETQLDMIASLQVPVTIFYDGDHAGQNAAWHFANMAMKRQIPVSMVKAADLKDADEIFIHEGAQALKDTVSKTVPFAEFAFGFLQNEFNLNNYEDKKAYASRMADLIRKTLSSAEQKAAFEKLEGLTGMDYRPIEHPSRTKRRAKTLRLDEVPELQDGRLNAEKAVLSAMLENGEYIDVFDRQLGFCMDETCEMLWMYLKDADRMMNPIDPLILKGMIREQEVEDLLDEVLEMEHTREDLETFFEQTICRLFELHLQRQIKDTDRQIAVCSDTASKLELIAKKAELIKERNHQKERINTLHAELHA